MGLPVRMHEDPDVDAYLRSWGILPAPQPEPIVVELLDAAREIEMRRSLLTLGIPPIGPRHYGPLPPEHIAYSLTAYRAIHGGTLPDLHEQRERRTLYLTQGRARSRP